MPYYQLRITLSESRTRPIVYRCFKALKQHLALETYSCGYEELNKFGEPCDPHYHFNFYEDKLDRCNPVRCIRDWIRRHFNSQDIELKGNKQWSFQMVEEPNDFERWFRYPLKEMPEQELCNMPQADENNSFDKQVILAREERKHTIHLNILARQKAMNKDQFKEKMYSFIKSYEETNHSEQDPLLKPDQYMNNRKKVWKLIYNFYRSIGKPINWTVIEGYTNLFLADSGVIDEDDAFNLAHGLY